MAVIFAFDRFDGLSFSISAPFLLSLCLLPAVFAVDADEDAGTTARDDRPAIAIDRLFVLPPGGSADD
jgi:hypothetical protein